MDFSARCFYFHLIARKSLQGVIIKNRVSLDEEKLLGQIYLGQKKAVFFLLTKNVFFHFKKTSEFAEFKNGI